MTPPSEQITPHFHRALFDQPAHPLAPAARYPTIYLPLLHVLCEQLEAIRDASFADILIVSGYRSPAYNRALGGSPTSYHLRGMAADIVSRRFSPLDLYALIRGLIALDALFIRGLGLDAESVHVDIRPGKLITWRDPHRKH